MAVKGLVLVLLLAGCTVKLPLDELRKYPIWMVAPQYRYLVEEPREPPIHVPAGVSLDDFG